MSPQPPYTRAVWGAFLMVEDISAKGRAGEKSLQPWLILFHVSGQGGEDPRSEETGGVWERWFSLRTVSESPRGAAAAPLPSVSLPNPRCHPRVLPPRPPSSTRVSV